MSERRHTIVSGGSRGLGGAIVSKLLEAGYSVTTFSRQSSPLIQQLSVAYPDCFHFFPGDLSKSQEIKTIAHNASERFGTPYGLINNAGIAIEGLLATMPPSEIDRLLCLNLASTLHLTREVLRPMLLTHGGRIINISSIVGLRGYRGLSAYAASKAGIDGMTRALARELGDRQITVNSVAPGYLETEMTESLNEAQRRQIIDRTPLGRLGTPEDITGVILFLLSDAARFITGQILTVDGGITC